MKISACNWAIGNVVLWIDGMTSRHDYVEGIGKMDSDEMSVPVQVLIGA